MRKNILHLNIKSVTNLTLVVLIAAAVTLSGCTEATGGSLMDKPGDYLGDDINEKYQEIRGSTEHVKTENNIETRENDAYNVHTSRENNKIKEIIITSKETGDKISLVNNDADPQIDLIKKNNEEVADENAAPVNDNQKAYGEVLELWAGTGKLSDDIDKNFWLNTENKPGKFYVGLELDALKDVKQIKLHTGGNVFDYRLAGTETNDDGSLSYIRFEDINAQGDPYDTKISFADDSTYGKDVRWATDNNRDGELDSSPTDEGADGKNIIFY